MDILLVYALIIYCCTERIFPIITYIFIVYKIINEYFIYSIKAVSLLNDVKELYDFFIDYKQMMYAL